MFISEQLEELYQGDVDQYISENEVDYEELLEIIEDYPTPMSYERLFVDYRDRMDTRLFSTYLGKAVKDLDLEYIKRILRFSLDNGLHTIINEEEFDLYEDCDIRLRIVIFRNKIYQFIYTPDPKDNMFEENQTIIYLDENRWMTDILDEMQMQTILNKEYLA